MSDLAKTKPSNPRRIFWAIGVLCITCCAAPFIGIAVGSATLAAFAIYSEGIALAIAAFGATLLAYKIISRRKVSSCNIDCSCRPTQDKGAEPKTS